MSAARSAPGAKPDPTRVSLGLIRIALLAGVLAFGGAIWFVQSRAGWTPSASPHDRTLRHVLMAAWALGVLGVLACFVLLQAPRFQRRASVLAIVGSAMGELPALAGGVHYLLTGAREWYVWGVGAMLITYFVFPIRGEARAAPRT